jgi:hypothetical protein
VVCFLLYPVDSVVVAVIFGAVLARFAALLGHILLLLGLLLSFGWAVGRMLLGCLSLFYAFGGKITQMGLPMVFGVGDGAGPGGKGFVRVTLIVGFVT